MKLVGEALGLPRASGHRTKFGWKIDPTPAKQAGLDSRPESTSQSTTPRSSAQNQRHRFVLSTPRDLVSQSKM